tara:strand:+ start:744 stop:1463 length:720 start_codon:yes stop_codon:yes gene_type:complete
MNASQNQKILDTAEDWFANVIAVNHKKKLELLVKPEEFNINWFLAPYLSTFMAGNMTSNNLAKALIYPRTLGTSITTIFGTGIQTFITSVLPAYGSTTSGIDVEFIDAVDGKKKYCQVKAGPQTLNGDDVETIHRHFNAAKNTGKTNNVKFTSDSFVIGVLYGTHSDLSANYINLEREHFYPVYAGQTFWHRLTGDTQFYQKLINRFAQVATSTDESATLERVITELASNLEQKYPDLF